MGNLTLQTGSGFDTKMKPVSRLQVLRVVNWKQFRNLTYICTVEAVAHEQSFSKGRTSEVRSVQVGRLKSGYGYRIDN